MVPTPGVRKPPCYWQPLGAPPPVRHLYVQSFSQQKSDWYIRGKRRNEEEDMLTQEKETASLICQILLVLQFILCYLHKKLIIKIPSSLLSERLNNFSRSPNSEESWGNLNAGLPKSKTHILSPKRIADVMQESLLCCKTCYANETNDLPCKAFPGGASSKESTC